MVTAAAAAKSLQSCPTLCDPIDGSPPGSPIPGILQARTPEWVAISFSNNGGYVSSSQNSAGHKACRSPLACSMVPLLSLGPTASTKGNSD